MRLVVGGVGALWRGGAGALPVLATAVVAVVFHPLRVRAQRRINRLVYGRRDDPYAVMRTWAAAWRQPRRPTRSCGPSSTRSARR